MKHGDNDLKGKFDIENLKDPRKRASFLKTNLKWIIVAIIILVLAIILFVGSCGSPDKNNPTAGDNLNYVVPGLEARAVLTVIIRLMRMIALISWSETTLITSLKVK